MLRLLLILISKSGGCHPLGPGMPFLNSDTCVEGEGYLFLPRFSSIHGQMTRWMDGKFHEKQPRCLLLYVMVNSLFVNLLTRWFNFKCSCDKVEFFFIFVSSN
jgi:hypothetical protein